VAALRVVSYNVRSFRAGVGEAAALLKDEAPDLVLVQEAGPRRRLHAAARALGMESVSSHRRFSRVRNAVLFRPPWRAIEVTVRYLSRERGAYPRGFVAVRLGRSGERLTAVSAHFSLTASERLRHAREFTDALAGIRGRIVVGADLNEEPGRPAVRWLTERLFDCYRERGEGPGETFPATSPTARIDYLLVTDGLTPLACRVAAGPRAERASDHRPVIADVEIEASSEAVRYAPGR
jgi:endonuclease/exonuclease/phosphatase family metal-dependent hydrolase